MTLNNFTLITLNVVKIFPLLAILGTDGLTLGVIGVNSKNEKEGRLIRLENKSYKNIAIYCDDHHNLIEGGDKKKSELR